MSHTPGPWAVQHYGDNEGDIHGSDGKLVCMMREGDTAPEEDWSADARLIACAPDMLTVLRRVIDMANCALEYAGVDDAHTLKRALERIGKSKRECERVIAQAEGRA